MRNHFYGITLLHFDDVYLMQSELKALATREYDLRSFSGTRYQCSLDTLFEIHKKIESIPENQIVFLGSGDYHYLTYLFLSKIKIPFSLILFDVHHDANPVKDELITCDSWVSWASRLSLLEKIFLIGVREKLNVYDFNRKLKVLSSQIYNDARRLIREISEPYVYISIDKDVLSTKFARTNWEQGDMSLDTLLEIIQMILSSKRILGIDVCGEACVEWCHLTGVDQSQKINEYTNLRIIRSCSPVSVAYRGERRKVLCQM